MDKLQRLMDSLISLTANNVLEWELIRGRIPTFGSQPLSAWVVYAGDRLLAMPSWGEVAELWVITSVDGKTKPEVDSPPAAIAPFIAPFRRWKYPHDVTTLREYIVGQAIDIDRLLADLEEISGQH